MSDGTANSDQPASSLAPAPGLQTQFTFFRTEMLATIKGVSEIAKDGSGNVLLGLGTAMIILGMFWKLAPAGLQFSSLAPSEFITLIISALLILAGGAGLKLYTFKLELSLSSRVQDAGVELVKTVASTGADFVRNPPKPDRP